MKIFTNKHPELGLEISNLEQKNNTSSFVEYYILNKPYFLIRESSEEEKRNNKYITFVRDIENKKEQKYEYEYEYVNSGRTLIPKKFYSEKEVFSYLQLKKDYLKKKQQNGTFELKYKDLTSTSHNYEYATNRLPKNLYIPICKETMLDLPIVLEVCHGTEVNEYTIQEFRNKYDEKNETRS